MRSETDEVGALASPPPILFGALGALVDPRPWRPRGSRKRDASRAPAPDRTARAVTIAPDTWHCCHDCTGHVALLSRLHRTRGTAVTRRRQGSTQRRGRGATGGGVGAVASVTASSRASETCPCGTLSGRRPRPRQPRGPKRPPKTHSALSLQERGAAPPPLRSQKPPPPPARAARGGGTGTGRAAKNST